MEIILPKQVEALQKTPIPLFDGNKRIQLPKSHGVYCFWWANDKHSLPGSTEVHFQGAFIGEERIKKEGISEDNLIRNNNRAYRKHRGTLKEESPAPIQLQDFTCLYVGKSDEASGIYGRVGKHLCVKSKKRSEYLKFRPKEGAPIEQFKYPIQGPTTIIKRNTSSQLRAGLEYIFRQEAETYAYDRMKDSVYVSWVSDENMTFRDRFYLENLAIGLFHPWFNLDSER